RTAFQPWITPLTSKTSVHLLAVVFFLQAEACIRDLLVTGVQPCALPIYPLRRAARRRSPPGVRHHGTVRLSVRGLVLRANRGGRSEERRVGKECRGGGGRVEGRRKGGDGEVGVVGVRHRGKRGCVWHRSW